MDLTMIGIFIGLILTGIVAGIPIGQAVEHRRLLKYRRTVSVEWPTCFTKEEIERVLDLRKEVR